MACKLFYNRSKSVQSLSNLLPSREKNSSWGGGGTSAPPHCVGFVLLIRPHASRIQESRSSRPTPLIAHTPVAACDNLFSVSGGLKTLSIHNTVHSVTPLSFPNLRQFLTSSPPPVLPLTCPLCRCSSRQRLFYQSDPE